MLGYKIEDGWHSHYYWPLKEEIYEIRGIVIIRRPKEKRIESVNIAKAKDGVHMIFDSARMKRNYNLRVIDRTI
jgi:hypothetical protein